MQRDVPMFILLPKKWDQDKNSTFPVVLSFHGNSNSFLTYFDLTFGCYNEDFLLVFPDGDLNTYFCDIPNDPRVRMETFITTELRLFLILNYRARNDRKWANIGVSAGGFGSIAIAMKHRDKFCAAASFAAHFILYDMPLIRDDLMEMRFGNKETNEKNYKPFNMTLIAESTQLQNNQLNIFFTSYSNDPITNLSQESRAFHHYLEAKNISHSFDEWKGDKHSWGWQDQTINKFFPFILNAFKNNCE
jgi:S-formylglutathione hydrolase FrmB